MHEDFRAQLEQEQQPAKLCEFLNESLSS